MKTLAKVEIDGYKIITNIFDAGGLIDQEATKEIVKKEIVKTDCYKNIEKIKKEMQVYANQATEARKNLKFAKTDQEKRKFQDEYTLRHGQIKELEKDLYPLSKELKEVRRDLVNEHAVYFQTVSGDEVVDDTKAETVRQLMIEATSEGKVITENLEKISNNKGKVYYKKNGSEWVKLEIKKLGEDPQSGAILVADLSESQLKEIAEYEEKERIKKLTSAHKTSEKESVIESLKSQAAIMKNKLEIEGDNKALKKAQDWLSAETDKVNIKYS